MAPSPLPVGRLRTLIESEGAISIATYMAIANAHYYATRDPLGSSGDFTTAPEISQMFGELLGLWLADLWLRAGRPRAALVELGPGRGTLMADARRAIARLPGLADAPVHFVETSAVLKNEQAKRVPDALWHDEIASLPEDHALLILANEFFDALPVRQFARTADGWRERMVALEDGRFIPVAGRVDVSPLVPPEIARFPEGSILETSPASAAIAAALSDRVIRQGGAGLIIDYGYEGPAAGDTLQAVRRHRYADVFVGPGEADLTAHVDFAALAREIRDTGAHAYGPTEQGALLKSLGIETRATALKQASGGGDTTGRRPAAIDSDVDRLTAPDQMGRLFKALAFTAPSWPRPAGF